MFIEGHCVTNLDEYHSEEWPKIFAKVPEKGDYVEAKSGKRLTVVGITHTMKSFCNKKETRTSPYIIVELHRRYD
jgi:hypothetical protein